MAYDFTRFSPQSFERLIQALAVATLGARVQVYGAGKDGAREATYTGRCRIADSDWDGYVVFQAKHHSTLGTPVSNADWLIRQIDEEMAKFEEPKRALKRPDYYVIASNVRLSAASGDHNGKGQGGIDKVSQHLAGWAIKLGFKGSHVWHADALASLLDAHPGVRTTFDFWVQPGDVLASVLRRLSGPDQTEVLTKYLRDSLRQSREIKTRDIGQAVGRTVTLDEVFIDLPVNLHSEKAMWPLGSRDIKSLEHDEEEDDFIFISDEDPFAIPRVVAQLVQHSADTFNPETWTNVDEIDTREGLCRHKELMPNRVVLLGGPGQGKSTIGQFLAQYLRARLLDEMKRNLSPEVSIPVRAVLKSAADQHIPQTGPLRYPFYIELPRYADLLSDTNKQNGHLSVIDYIGQDLGKGSAHKPTAETLIQWLTVIPSTIIFDGLDEVPPSGNRSEVINAIEELVDVLHSANADFFVFVTSRPQGYQQELSPALWSHWELNPLKAGDALELASKVAPVLVSELTRRTEVLAILSEAAQEEATASLMTSPLQVMLLFHLVATHNNIPKDRWTLFYRHYEILRDREIAKGGTAGTTIRTYRTQIDRIHQDAGYLLHLRAEISGGADAYFTDNEFRALVRKHLERDGFDEQLDTLASDIAKLATNRLVFLRSAVEGRVAFDVRSLQEFMAAGRLTASPEASIRDRLYEIAGRAHWQMVLKIAFSKIYASIGHEGLHDALVGLLDSLDAGDRESDDRLLLTGSRLALDLLLDGIMLSAPGYRRKLLVRAINLISIPESKPVERLKSVLDLSQRALLEPLFIKSLNSTRVVRRCTLQLLLLSSSDQSEFIWVTDLILAWLPDDEEIFKIFDKATLIPTHGEAMGRLRTVQWRTSPAVVSRWMNTIYSTSSEEVKFPRNAIVFRGNRQRSSFRLRGDDQSTTAVELFYCPLTGGASVDEPPDYALPAWKIARAVAIFSEEPSLVSAAAFLQAVSDQESFDVSFGIPLPWLLDALVRSVGNKTQCVVRIGELLAGHYGDLNIWNDCELSWAANGVSVSNIRVASDFVSVPLDIISMKGPPLIGRSFEQGSEGGEIELLSLLKRHPDSTWARSAVIFFAARRKVSMAEEFLSVLLQPDPPSMAHTSLSRNYQAVALVRMLTSGFDKGPIVTRLRQIVQNRSTSLIYNNFDIRIVIDLVNDYPEAREFINLLADCWLRFTYDRKKLVLPKTVFERELNDTPQIAASVTLLRILEGYPSPHVNSDLELLFEVRGSVVGQLFSAFGVGSAEDGRKKLLPLSREILIRRRERFSDRAFELLRNVDEARPVTLRDDGRARTLNLPSALETH